MSEESKVTESVTRRALEVQEIYLTWTKTGLSNVEIYRRYIQPIYFISERTYYRYLERNAKRDVRQFEKDDNIDN